MNIIEAVIENADHFEYKWKEHKTDARKFLSLMEEVGELASSLKGDHEHPMEVELIQIAGICINWLGNIPNLNIDETLKIANHL